MSQEVISFAKGTTEWEVNRFAADLLMLIENGDVIDMARESESE